MKIIYMGTPDFAVEALEALASSRHEVTAVFTQPDKPKGRGKAMQFTPVKEVALRENIPVYQPKKVRDPEVIQKIRDLHRMYWLLWRLDRSYHRRSWTSHRMAASMCMVHFYRNIAELLRSSGR